MKNLTWFMSVLVILSVSAFTIVSSVAWKVKEGYSVKWEATTFSGLKASIQFNESYPEKSKIIASIDARTINTGNALKDAHAREALQTSKFPFITFESITINKTGMGYETTGNLTLKGVTRRIKFPFVFDSKRTSVHFPFFPSKTFCGVFTISPKAFNVTAEGTPEEVTLELKIPVVQ